MKVPITNYENILIYFQDTTLHYKLLFNFIQITGRTNGITDIRPWYSQHAQSLPFFTLLLVPLVLPVSGALK